MLNSKKISDRVVSQLDGIGIKSRVGNDDSHTAKMVEIIVREVILAIQTDAEVYTFVNDIITVGNATTQNGKGTGQGGIK